MQDCLLPASQCGIRNSILFVGGRIGSKGTICGGGGGEADSRSSAASGTVVNCWLGV